MRSRIDLLRVVTMLAVLDCGAVRVCGAGATAIPAAVRHRLPDRSEIARALETRQSRSEPRTRTDDQGASLERRDRASGRPAAPTWLDGLPACFTGSNNRRASSCGSRSSCWSQCWSCTSRARFAAQRDSRAMRTRSSHRLTFAIWTSGPKAFPTTLASPRVCCGIAVNIAWRSRCFTAACCRGSRTFTRVPIRDSSTEGDCLVLATSASPAPATRIRLARRTGLAAIRVRPPRHAGRDRIRIV